MICTAGADAGPDSERPCVVRMVDFLVMFTGVILTVLSFFINMFWVY